MYIHLLFGVFASGYLSYRLGLALTEPRDQAHGSSDHLACALGGLSLMVSPYMISVLGNGQAAKVQLWLLPAGLLCLLRFTRDGRWWALPTTVGVFSLAAVTSPYYFVFLVGVAGALALFDLVRRHQGVAVRAARWTLALGAALTLSAVTLQQSGLLADTSTMGTTPARRDILGEGERLPEALMRAPLDRFFHPVLPAHINPARVIHVTYLGWATLALALAALMATGPCPWFWVACALLSGLYALGPTLWLGSKPLLIFDDGSQLLLPLALLEEAFPSLARVAATYRAVSVVQLCLALIIATRAGPLLRRIGRRGSLIGAAAGLLLLLDGLLIAPGPWPVPLATIRPPEALLRLGASKIPGALLMLPLQDPEPPFRRERYLMQQLNLHGRPLGNGNNFLGQNTVTPAMGCLKLLQQGSPAESSPACRDIHQELRRRRVRYLVFAPVAYPATDSVRYLRNLQTLLGQAQRFPDGSLLWDMGSDAPGMPRT